MNEPLRRESERLAVSWMRHDSAMLRDYLVSGVEDPRINLQSILSRHFILQHLAGEKFMPLMHEEHIFSAAMNWCSKLARPAGTPEEMEAVLFALKRGADNAEGIEIPQFILGAFRKLPATCCDQEIPNYIARRLAELSENRNCNETANVFCELWRRLLSSAPPSQHQSPAPRVLEPACGSATDYRVMAAAGITGRIAYQGFDLCEKNIRNALELFPKGNFEIGNVFEIAAPDQAFDLCIVHDLFEHLSEAALNVAASEICRVTRHGICLGFFNMTEGPGNLFRPYEDYHWNQLSVPCMKDLFARHGFWSQVIHIGTFLNKQVGCAETHNPNAYTFCLQRR